MNKLIKYRKISFCDVLRKLIFSWLIAVTIEYFMIPAQLRDLDELAGLAEMSFVRVLALTILGTMVLTVIFHEEQTKIMERWGICLAYGIYGCMNLWTSFSYEFLGFNLIVFLILGIYAFYGWKQEEKSEPAKILQEPDLPGNETGQVSFCSNREKNREWIFSAITGLCAVVFCVFISAWTIGRIYSFSTPTFDFGIFSQMFYYMKETGLPMTTLERDGLLSHFYVHVSPIYYLMLPFYFLFPKAETLQILQAVVVTSAVIPLWKIGKKKKIPAFLNMLLCIVMMLYPAFSGGCGYDLHENCFLIPLILWIFYGIECENLFIIIFSAAMTMLVKEDAAVYTAVIGLWLVIKNMLYGMRRNKKMFMTGGILFLLSILWFFCVTGFLAEVGDGVMTYRYKNFIYDGTASLITVIKAVIINPMKAIYECADSDKMTFIGTTMAALAGIPLLTRKYERYILLIPYVLMNLMSDYTYQHNIFFQYSFGATAFLFYLFVINIADWKENGKRTVLIIVPLLLNAVLFSGVIVPKAVYYPRKAMRFYHYYQGIRDTFSRIPEDASVTAGTFYTTELSNRKIIYDIHYSSIEHMLSTEYIVLQENSVTDYRKFADKDGTNGYENLIRILEENGYTILEKIEGVVTIYRK